MVLHKQKQHCSIILNNLSSWGLKKRLKKKKICKDIIYTQSGIRVSL